MTEASGIVVTMRHVRAAGLCGPGVRAWFSQHDRALLRTFCRSGLPVETIEAQGDAFAMKVSAIARQEAEHGR
jgi:hypothetical protein